MSVVLRASPQYIHQQVVASLAESNGAFSITNQEAMDALYERIAMAGRTRKMLSYSELVRGIKFECAEVSDKPFEIFAFDWQGPMRRMIGYALARITERTILDAGCIITTVIIDNTNNTPSRILFEWLHDMGIIPDLEENTILAFWATHVTKTQEYFKNH